MREIKLKRCEKCGEIIDNENHECGNESKETNFNKKKLHPIHIISWIIVVGGVLGAFVVEENLNEAGINSSILPVFVLVATIINAIILYGFGTLVQNSDRILQAINKMEK